MAVIAWLTALTEVEVKCHLEQRSTFAELFAAAPMAAGAPLIKGGICGLRGMTKMAMCMSDVLKMRCVKSTILAIPY